MGLQLVGQEMLMSFHGTTIHQHQWKW